MPGSCATRAGSGTVFYKWNFLLLRLTVTDPVRAGREFGLLVLDVVGVRFGVHKLVQFRLVADFHFEKPAVVIGN